MENILTDVFVIEKKQNGLNWFDCKLTASEYVLQEKENHW